MPRLAKLWIFGSKRGFGLNLSVYALAIVASCLLIVGCQSGQYPDPNDPAAAGIMQPEVISKDLKVASDSINERVAEGQISIDQGKQILEKYAHSLLGKITVQETPVADAWEYGQAYITAHDWSKAVEMLKVALKHPPNEDRWVNDTLRLAHCEAELGQVDEAISLTKSTFRASPEWKWPILYATYLEIVPAALKHSTGKELVLAKLTEDAIKQHEQATGDPSQERFKAWMAYRTYQIRQAWQFIAQIYRSVGEQKLAEQAEADANRQPTTYKV